MLTFAVAGLTLTLVTVAVNAVTVTVAVSDFVVSTVEVAFTVSVAAVSSVATDRRPSLLMIVVFLLFPETDHVTVCAGLLFPATVAVKVCPPPCATLAVLGLTLTLVTVAVGALVTVTVAVPDLLLSTVETALTVSLVRVSLADMVRRPLWLIAVPLFLPVSTIDHVTVCAGELVPLTVAVN